MNSGKQLRIGVLGCGPIAQAGHFESCVKGKNTVLQALCDQAEDLRQRMAAIWEPHSVYADYQEMLDDPDVDAVIIAAADAFHVELSLMALQAGKHVLCEKPLAISVESALELQNEVEKSGKVFQIGHMKRFDPGLQAAHYFLLEEAGETTAYKGWYCDHSHHYMLTDAVQPVIYRSADKKACNRS